MKRSEKLTSRQKQVLAFLQDRQEQTGFAPTLHETADHFGFKSPNSVRQHLRLIEKKGFVHRVPGRSRALVVVRVNQAETETVRVPLLGRIPAGNPVMASEEREAFLSLPAQFYRGIQLFALRVHGSSMKNAGILDGDIAVLDGAREILDGVIGAIVINNVATLKRIYRKPDGLLLKAENPEFRDLKITGLDTEQTRIVGVLVGVIRKV
jgi:repressor LexA